jgi:hypothetical protein
MLTDKQKYYLNLSINILIFTILNILILIFLLEIFKHIDTGKSAKHDVLFTEIYLSIYIPIIFNLISIALFKTYIREKIIKVITILNLNDYFDDSFRIEIIGYHILKVYKIKIIKLSSNLQKGTNILTISPSFFINKNTLNFIIDEELIDSFISVDNAKKLLMYYKMIPEDNTQKTKNRILKINEIYER